MDKPGPVAWRYRYDGGKWTVQKNKPDWYKPSMPDLVLEPLFPADDPGLWRFWNEKAQTLAKDNDHLRQELAKAREQLAEPPEPLVIICESCGSVARGEYTNECDCTKMGLDTQRLVGSSRAAFNQGGSHD